MQEILPNWGFLGFLCLLVFVLLFVAVVLAIVNAVRSGRRPSAPPPGPRDGRPREPRPVPARRSNVLPVQDGNCPECGTKLAPDSPEGLCPQCLLKGALDDSPGLPEERKVRTTPHGGPFAAPTPDELAPHFPHLEIIELIGQGGMGAVYKARHIKLDRLVALKVLPPEWDSDPAFAERFAREARTLARLNHPHIVAVHDFGEAGGLFYLVMEYVDGPNLREVLHAGQLAAEQALALVPQLCEALQYAHEEGVVHRDIKPENILLDRRGRVKIADFGLAKLLNRPRAEFTLTGSRQVMGTLDYMAPEQRHSPLAIDHRADIYSLGVVFYEMLTGELPLGHFAPPSEKAAVDARLDAVVLRALKTDPGQRYQSVGEVKTDVESITNGQAPAAVRVGEPGDGQELAQALHQVRGPATGLLLAGILAPLASAVLCVIGALMDSEFMHYPGMAMFRATNGPPPIAFLTSFFFALIPGGILIAGALKMRKCEAYELALMASIIAMIPITGLAYPLSLPMGIWNVVILRKKQVLKGFALNLQRKGLPGAPAVRFTKPPTPRRGVLRSVWAMFFTTRPGDRSRWESGDRF
jgi:tRNA A-37 threonylcarbamoyl transferase component Bud32